MVSMSMHIPTAYRNTVNPCLLTYFALRRTDIPAVTRILTESAVIDSRIFMRELIRVIV